MVSEDISTEETNWVISCNLIQATVFPKANHEDIVLHKSIQMSLFLSDINFGLHYCCFSLSNLNRVQLEQIFWAILKKL